jgi:hypothetical protein
MEFMHWTSIGLMIIAGLNIFLAFFVWLRNPKNKINIYFSIALVSTALWGVTESLMLSVKTEPAVTFYGAVTYIFGIIIASSFLIFSLYFPFEIEKIKKSRILFIYLLSVIPIGVAVTPGLLIENGILEQANLPFNDLALNSLGFWTYFVFFIFCFSWSFYNLAVKYSRSEGFAKKQIKYLTSTIFIAVVFAIIFDLIIPYFKGEIFGWVGPYFTLLIVFAITYLLFFAGRKVALS